MSTCWTVVEFDGHAVELTRRAWLLPWGRTTRFALDSLLVLDIPRRRSRDNAPRDNNVLVLHGEDGGRAWTQHVGLGRSARRLGHFVWFTYCVNEALAERARLLLAARGPSTPGGPAAWDAEYTEMIMRLLYGPHPGGSIVVSRRPPPPWTPSPRLLLEIGRCVTCSLTAG